MKEFSFIPLQAHHFPLMLKWLRTPHVRKFWDPHIEWNEKRVEENYHSYVEGYKLVRGKKESIQAFVISFEGKSIGYIQLYDAKLFPRQGYLLEEQLSAEFAGLKVAAIDIFLGEPSALGKGHGARAIEQFVQEHVHGRFDACIVDPETENHPARRMYEKAGFVHAKQLRIGTQILELMVKRLRRDYGMQKFVVVVECAIEHRGKFLLIKRPKEAHAGGLLAFPGGKVDFADGSEDKNILEEAAKREVLEEVGLELVDPLRFVTSASFSLSPEKVILDVIFHCKIEKTVVVVKPSSREVSEYYWLSREEIATRENSPPWLKRYISCIPIFREKNM